MDAFEVHQGRKPLDSTSGIYIFLNYKKIEIFKVKEQARDFILKMIETAPAEVNKEREIFLDYLLKNLR